MPASAPRRALRRQTAPKIAAETAKAMTKTLEEGESRGATSTRKRAGRTKSHGRRSVRFTHPDRVYWADVGVTKQDLADYYRSVWDWMAPHVVNRPLALLRCPDGTSGPMLLPEARLGRPRRENISARVIDSKRRQVIAVEDLDGLLSLVQAGVLEVHVRGSTIDRLDRLQPHRLRHRSRRRRRLGGRRRGGARRARSGSPPSISKLRQALRRQGPARRAADRRRRLGHHQDLRAGGRAGDDRRRSRALRRQDDEVAAQGKDLHRLSAQLAGADLGRGLFDARARGRAGVGAGDVGGTRPHQGRQPVHACSIWASVSAA